MDCSCMREYQNKLGYLEANIPEKYWDFTLRNLTGEFIKENKMGLTVLQKYREKIDGDVINFGLGLYIQGSVGLAKSALAYHTLKHALNKNLISYSIRLSSLTKLIFDSLKDTRARQQLDWIKMHVQIFMIDEIEKDYKVGSLDQFAGIQLNEFFSMLYEKKKALIITSNIPKSELRNIHADNVVDRLEELVDIVFTGQSFRKPNIALNTLME